MTHAWQVRRARPTDVGEIDAMIHELAGYEREPDAVDATPEDLLDALFGPAPHAFAHVAPAPGGRGLAGFALWFLTYSTWTGRPGIWLEDLYVRPDHRGAGIGRALLSTLARECQERGYRRLEWAVLDWNAPSIAFYRGLGARPLDDWTTYRVDGDALPALAGDR